MSFFDKEVKARIRTEDIKDIDRIIKKNPKIYKDRSHFVRSAIIKNIREETGGENEQTN